MNAANLAYYLLRWRFDFKDGVAPACGMWSDPGNVEVHGAWRQGRAGRGVARATVEGKHVTNRTTHALAEVPGEGFVLFQWLAFARLDPLAIRGAGGVPTTTLEGLQIVTRSEIVTVFNSGKVTREPRSRENLQIGFATYSQ